MFRRLRHTFCTVLLALAGALSQAAPAKASELELVRDFVGSTEFGALAVAHETYFVLPTTAQQIRPIDWILLSMPDYTAITTSGMFVRGGYGNPVIDIQGTTIRITNIAVLPGNSVEIINYSANNPPASGSPLITITIAEDGNGTVVRNRSSTIPSNNGTFITVSASIENTLSGLNLSGFTSPSAFVSLIDGTSVVGTTVADGTGFFRFILSGITGGPRSYTVFSTDSASRSTSQTILSVFLLTGTVTTVSGVLLSSTLTLSANEINPGDPLGLSGTAKPNSQINIFIEAPLRSYSTSTDATGQWNLTVAGTDTSGFTPGEYQSYTIVQDSVGTQSIVSPVLTFRVRAGTVGDPPPCGDISRGDLNCDGRVNLTDFSILLFHWQTSHRVADINSDSRVNLTDFSIMMFYFAR